MKRFFRIDYKGTPRHVIEAADGGPWRLLEGELFGQYEGGDEVARDAHRVLAPLTPSKIVCIGLNYKDHAAEQGKPLPKSPLMFIKPSTSVVGPGETILLPDGIGRVDHEAEVGIVIGKRAHHVSESDAPGFVFGLTCVNDVTARELQQKGAQYTHAKGFDTFAPIGPCVTAGIDYHTIAGVGIEGWVNGERRQNSSTKQLVFSIDYLVAYITNVMTLLPGDIIATGTPSGIGPLEAGDSVTIRIPGVGDLINPVADEPRAREEVMKFFIDSGHVPDIEPLVPLGIIDGVTTNPSLLAKEKGDPREILKKICDLVKGPVSAEVVQTEAQAMIKEGRELAKIDPHIVVKVPLTRDGIKACKALADEGTRVNVTLCFSPAQALLAAKVGATYISPFVGRLDDIATPGMDLIRDIVEIYANYNFKTEVLVASTRGPMHIVEAARMGADICTCPPAVIDSLFNHPLTDSGLKKFLADWEKAQAATAGR